ncbi:hypothetical protein ACIBSW_40095 [Actinoplanes sp. NPDC049668]|uniref:hypothetical protein n=1 Tax=unclassified Actinoplanes TaxID=2626549 RepID=UPI0033A72C07
MRRLLSATAASGALLLLGAGCSSGKVAENTTAAPVPAIPAPGASTPASGASAGAALPGEADAALSGNSEAICQQAAKTGGDAAKNFAQDLKLLIDAETSQDKDSVVKAKQKTARDVENYSFALKDMSKLAADPKLKAALADMGSQVTALKGDVRKIDSERLDKLQKTLDKACGNG